MVIRCSGLIEFKLRRKLQIKTFRKDEKDDRLQRSETYSSNNVDKQLIAYGDKMAKAGQRYNENYQKKSVPKTLYYVDDNDDLINRVEEHLKNQRKVEEKKKEQHILKSWNKMKLIEKNRHNRIRQVHSTVNHRKASHEEKYNHAQEKLHQMSKDFEKFRKSKFKNYQDKQRSMEEQKNYVQLKLEKKRKINMFKQMDQKDNFNREKTFYGKFKDKILTKHQTISQTVYNKRVKEKEFHETKIRDELEVMKKGPLLVTNYIDSYIEMHNKKYKTQKKAHKFQSLTSTKNEFDLLKVLPKIKDDKDTEK
jgi:hypothetical protein